MAPKVRFLSPKLYLLRLIVIFSSVALLLQCNADVRADNTFGIILISCILLHHLLDFLHPEFLFGIVDLLVLFGFEVPCLSNYVDGLTFTGWSGQIWVLYVVLAWMILVALSVEAILRIMSVSIYAPEFFSKPFHLITYWNHAPSHQDMPKVHHAFFGRSIWKEHFKGESVMLRFSRGTITAICIVVILVFSAGEIIMGSVAESGVKPVKDFRSIIVPLGLPNFGFVWTVVIARSLTLQNVTDNDIQHLGDILHSAVQVTPLWNDALSVKPGCDHFPDSIIYDEIWPVIQVIKINCPAQFNDSDIEISPPDLLVAVNFTTLEIPSNSITDTRLNGVQIMVGATNNTDNVVYRTIPTTIPAGVNLMGTLYMEARQVFKKPALSSLGIFQSFDTFNLVSILNLFPDPQASRSPLIPSSPDISTLRLFLQNDYSEYRAVQDYQEKSIINAISDAGGLWTSLSGIFAVIFGSSLLGILFGTKPLSVFGLAHSLQRTRIQAANREKYPKISEELNSANSERGVLSLLGDEVLDLSFFKRDEPTDIMNNEDDSESIPLNNLSASVLSPTSTPSIHTVHRRGTC